MKAKIDVERGFELYRQGLSNREIADDLGCSEYAWRHHLRKAGMKPNPPAAKSRKHAEEKSDDSISQLNDEARAQGMSYGQYVAALHCGAMHRPL